MPQLLRTSIFLATVLIFVISCEAFQTPKKRAKKTQPDIYFTHGDPNQLIGGSTLNKTSFIDIDFLDSIGSFHISSFTLFSEKSEKDYTDYSKEEVLDEADTSDRVEELEEELKSYNFIFDEPNNRYVINFNDDKTNIDDPEELIVFEDADENGVWELSQLLGTPIEILHYSVKPDKSAFSFLGTLYDETYGKVIITITFIQDRDALDLKFSDTKIYQFLFGQAKVRWQQDFTLSFCGNYSYSQELALEDSIQSWFKNSEVSPYELGNTRVRHSYEFRSEYPPFSDVNTHCLYYVDDFILENNDSIDIYGITFPQIDQLQNEITDSDVFIFLDNLPYESRKEKTIVHEIGHFLGLGHEFTIDEKLKFYKYDSIMSYREDIYLPTAHDLSALEDLYTD